MAGDANCESIWKAVGEGMVEDVGFCSSVSWAVDNVLKQQFSAVGCDLYEGRMTLHWAGPRPSVSTDSYITIYNNSKFTVMKWQ